MGITNIIIIVILVMLSGLFSGLTLGLMSLNPHSLKRKMKMGNKEAAKIYPLRRKGNLLLCTLLFGNVAVNAGLSIFLGSLTKGFTAGLIATGLIVIFGEILPQSILSRYALVFGAKTTWMVYPFIYLFYPITKPLAFLLDKFLGDELPTVYSKKEFHMILEEHLRSKKSAIDKDEFEILKGGLVFSSKKVKDVMTPKKNTFFIDNEDALDKEMLTLIQSWGHSRLPIYDPGKEKVIGLLYVKDLINVDPADNIGVETIARSKVITISENERLDNILNLFRKERVHLFIVVNKSREVVGIITLEDVLEEIVGEIVDEYDLFVDMRDMS